jgi:hypothetical protein
VKQAGPCTGDLLSVGEPGGTRQASRCSRSRVPPGSPPTLIPLQGARLIEIRAVDRETARKNMSSGLVAGGFAAAVFALCFVAAFLYIAQ